MNYKIIVYLTFNGKQVRLHDLQRLPSGSTVRLACHPLKGGGAQKPHVNKIQGTETDSRMNQEESHIQDKSVVLETECLQDPRADQDKPRDHKPKEAISNHILDGQNSPHTARNHGSHRSSPTSCGTLKWHTINVNAGRRQ